MQFGGRGGRGGLEMGPLCSPVVTSYRLPKVTIGLSLTVFPVLRLVTDRRTDRQSWSSKRWHHALKCICRQKPICAGNAAGVQQFVDEVRREQNVRQRLTGVLKNNTLLSL